ncbi:hypothetical protein SGUI_1867 [Serinicoccus hydrothermalis]|uniref:Uncharacterized protein n=1 Tax=Serinicoccus hydrothermalis TaxID=1758689 RepID=A0A1B1NCW2_9MICO|nr:hypothetical protein SGUI_1867 [Serinicoccus hydrothermalis]
MLWSGSGQGSSSDERAKTSQSTPSDRQFRVPTDRWWPFAARETACERSDPGSGIPPRERRPDPLAARMPSRGLRVRAQP